MRVMELSVILDLGFPGSLNLGFPGSLNPVIAAGSVVLDTGFYLIHCLMEQVVQASYFRGFYSSKCQGLIFIKCDFLSFQTCLLVVLLLWFLGLH